MRFTCLLTVFLPLLCVAQPTNDDLSLLVGTGIGKPSELRDFTTYGVQYRHTVATFHRWSVSLGGGWQFDRGKLTTDGQPDNRPANDHSIFQITTRTVSLGATVGISLPFGAYSGEVFLQPQYVVLDDLAVEENFAEEHGVAMQRRQSLDGGFGLRRDIGPHWSVGVLGRIPIVAPRVDLLRSNVICPIIAPCVVLAEQRYDSRALRPANLSVSLGYGF